MGKILEQVQANFELEHCIWDYELQCMWIYGTGYFGKEEVTLIMRKA